MVVGSLFPLVSIPIITNELSPSEFGAFALAQVYALVAVNVSNFGLLVGYERNYFEYGDDSDKASSLFYSALIFTAIVMLILSLCVYFFGEAISYFIFNDKQHVNLILFIVIGESLLGLSQYYYTYLRNAGLASTFAKLSILRSGLYFSLLIIFLKYFELGLDGMAYAILFSGLIMFAIVVVKSLKDIRFSFDKMILLSTLKMSIPLTPRTLFGFINVHFDKIMLGALASLGGVGVYSIGQKISYVIFQFMTALEYVFIPGTYQKLFSDNDDERKSIGVYLTPFLYFTIFFAFLVILFSEELLFILLPSSYYGAVDVIVILSVFYASVFFGKLTGTQLIFAKKTYITSVLTFSSIAINVALNIPLITYWGVTGAAFATLLAGIINGVIGYKIAARYAPIFWEWNKIIPMFVVLVLAAIWVSFSRASLIISYEYRLLGKMVLLIGFVWVGFYMSLLSRKHIVYLLKQAIPDAK